MHVTPFLDRFVPLSALILLVLATATRGEEEAGGRFANWAKVDVSDQRRMYVDAMREAGSDAFSGEIRTFAVEAVLPQLQLEANRGTIDVVRRKMRSLLLDNVGDAKSFESASRAVLEFMVPLARDEKADPLVRINAMLLIGELRARDNKLLPWAGSLEELTKAAADGRLPAYLRIAALAGLVGHVDAAQKKGTATAANLGKTLVPVLASIVAAPVSGDRAAGDWLAARALDMLPVVMPELSAEAAAPLAKMLSDASRSTDVRVRAAAALGAAARAASKVDASGAMAAIRGLATASLEADLQTAERHSGGGAAPGPAPPPVAGAGGVAPAAAGDTHVPEPVCRRAAWRCAVLARAIGAEDGKGGLIELLPENEKGPARDLAFALVQGSQNLDNAPCDQAMWDLLELIRNPVAATPTAVERGGTADADPFGR